MQNVKIGRRKELEMLEDLNHVPRINPKLNSNISRSSSKLIWKIYEDFMKIFEKTSDIYAKGS